MSQENARHAEVDALRCFLPLLSRKQARLDSLEKECVKKGLRVELEEEEMKTNNSSLGM